MRTLKEECLYLHDFESLEEARQEDRCVHRTLQPRVAPGAARVSDPGPGPSGAHPEGGMIRPPTWSRKPEPGTRGNQTKPKMPANTAASTASNAPKPVMMLRNLSTTMGHSTGLIREQCPVW